MATKRFHFRSRPDLLTVFCPCVIASLFSSMRLFAAVVPRVGQVYAARQLRVMTWADENTASWDQQLDASGIRMGCSAEPASCLEAASHHVQKHPGIKVFLSTVLDPQTAVIYAAEYSKLSLQYAFIQEIDIDDFVGQYGQIPSFASPFAIVSSVIDALKSQNQRLQFGITLYENELESPYLKEENLPDGVRGKVDTVHLFLLYRADASNYADYVRRSKKLFRNAKVIAGVYAYDRISYVPCSPNVSRACSPEEEIGLFKQALDIQVRLAKSGEVEWLEFFPGAFGKEDEWNAWDRPRICPGRKQECITNTKQMRQLVLAAFSKKPDRKQ